MPVLLALWALLAFADIASAGTHVAFPGQAVTFKVSALGTPPFRHQWHVGDQPLPGATESSLRIANLNAGHSGEYWVEVSNAAGSARSPRQILQVLPEADSPKLRVATPGVHSVGTGGSLILAVAFDGAAPESLSWYLGAERLAGQHEPTLALGSVSEEAIGLYSVEYTLRGARRREFVAAVRLEPGAGLRLINLSIMARVENAPLIAGIVTNAGRPALLLFRAAGPSLRPFGIGDAMLDPAITVYEGQEPTAANDDWGADPDSWLLPTTFSLAGAFPFQDRLSRDSALRLRVSGPRSVLVQPQTGAGGTVLLEAYDLLQTKDAELGNISARSHASRSRPLVLGFVLAGPGERRLLLRGVGPTLAAFGVPATAPDPRLVLHRLDAGRATVIASNEDWGGAPEVAAASLASGAFPLRVGSRDAAFVQPLSAGNYTLTVTDFGEAGGEALAEAYLVPEAP